MAENTEKIDKETEQANAGAASATPKTKKRALKKRRKRKIREDKSSFKSEMEKQIPWLSRLLTIIVVMVLVIPLYFIFYKIVKGITIDGISLLPDTHAMHHVIAAFSLVSMVGVGVGLYFLFRRFRSTMISIIALVVATLTVTTLMGKYSFSDMVDNYQKFIDDLKNPDTSVTDVITIHKFPKENEFRNACKVTPKIKQFANQAARSNFKKKQEGDYRVYIQCFSVFKEINGKWNYVNDPNKWDYIAPAEESLESFAGDCDDYAVLMATCLNSVGGVVRLVRTPNHVYPELKINDQKTFEYLSSMIRHELFTPTTQKKVTYKKGKKITTKISSGKIDKVNYHTDNNGNIWLNMDYTAKYPGGKFMSSDIIAVMVLK